MKKFIHKNRGEIIVFFLSIFLLLLIFQFVGIFDHTILISDLLNAFYPFYKHLSRLLVGDVGIFSFNLGMGDSFLGVLYFYMSSPFNFFYFLLKILIYFVL